MTKDRDRIAYKIGMGDVEFVGECHSIVVRWRAGKGSADAIRALEQHAYELISHTIDNGLRDLWDARESRLDRRGRRGHPNLFRTGLRVIFADSPASLERRQRELSAVRLAHAYKHFVPAPFLSGFLGSVTRRPKPGIQPGFDAWIAYHLKYSEADHDDRADEYPSSVEDLRDSIRSAAFFSLSTLRPRTTRFKARKLPRKARTADLDDDDGEGWD